MGKLSENQEIEVDILGVKCWLGELHFDPPVSMKMVNRFFYFVITCG